MAVGPVSKIIARQAGSLGIIHLNRPKAYHALDIEMVYSLQNILKDWQKKDHKDLQAFILKSNPAKRPTFCSGGDVKSIALDVKNNVYLEHGQGKSGLVSADFFRSEYHVNHALANLNKTQISLWDGLVFGGGVGISIYGKYRVATENTLFAMPETAIGFFPDVGALYQMPKLMPSTAMVSYLVLTGHRLEPADLLYSGLATHYVPSKDLETMEEALEMVLAPPNQHRGMGDDVIEPVLESFNRTEEIKEKRENCFLAQNASAIDQAFGDLNRPLEQVVESLDDGSTFGTQTLETLQKMSPTAMKITWELLRCGAGVATSAPTPTNLADHLALEYRLSQHLMKHGSDFHEGIRAALLDSKKKNKLPAQWNPPTLNQVSDAHVQSYYFGQPIQAEWTANDSPIFTEFKESRL
mmetsp:Transcript_323/g.900  ORF Transcript_323/g.900 Transcript_323/m.900 type:complete len:411 (+) Transcript_323:90-1322(+)